MTIPTAQQVLDARKAAGMTQEQAAACVYVTVRSWQGWEWGEVQMPAAKWELFQIKVRAPWGGR